MSRLFVFDGTDWCQVKSVSAFHHGIGFVKLNSVQVFDGIEWLLVELDGQGLRLVHQENLVQV